MFEKIRNYIYIGAVVYALVCFLDALFIPLKYSLFPISAIDYNFIFNMFSNSVFHLM